MARYLDPKNDLTFKRIFGEHPDLLMGFLNALMPLSPDRLIQEIEYLPTDRYPTLSARRTPWSMSNAGTKAGAYLLSRCRCCGLTTL